MNRKANPEFDAFTNTVDQLLAVPRSELQKREREYREKVAQNPRKRGPKRKVKPSASHDVGGA
jgi:predicted DNA-binding WGR domain protein